MLRSRLCHFYQVDETAFTLLEPCNDRLLWELREVLILHYEVVQIIPQVVRTGSPTMTVKDSEEAYLGPLNVQMGLALRLEYVENYRDSVFVVFSDDALVRVCCI